MLHTHIHTYLCRVVRVSDLLCFSLNIYYHIKLDAVTITLCTCMRKCVCVCVRSEMGHRAINKAIQLNIHVCVCVLMDAMRSKQGDCITELFRISSCHTIISLRTDSQFIPFRFDAMMTSTISSPNKMIIIIVDWKLWSFQNILNYKVVELFAIFSVRS